MWLSISNSNASKCNNPAVIVAVSTSLPQYRALYSQARELGSFMLRKMEFERIATFHSSSLAPEITVRDDGLAALPGCYMHLSKGKTDILLLTGDSSPTDDQYEFARIVLEYAEGLGAKELYSVGARWVESPLSPDSDPVPNGFATDGEGVDRLRKCGVKILREEPAPFFASVVVALAPEYGMRGYKLSVDHGEPSPHPRSVAGILEVLSSMLEFEVSTDELVSQTVPNAQPTQLGDQSIYH